MVKETETDICSLRDTFAFCLHRWKNGIDKKLWPTCRRPRVHHAHRQSLRQPALEMASRASDWQHRRGYELLLRGRSEVRQALGCRRCQISRPCAVPSVEASTVRIRYSAVTSIPALLPSTNSRSARGGTHVNECNRLVSTTIARQWASRQDFPRYCRFAYSAWASFRMGMSGSASFQSTLSYRCRLLTLI